MRKVKSNTFICIDEDSDEALSNSIDDIIITEAVPVAIPIHKKEAKPRKHKPIEIDDNPIQGTINEVLKNYANMDDCNHYCEVEEKEENNYLCDGIIDLIIDALNN